MKKRTVFLLALCALMAAWAAPALAASSKGIRWYSYDEGMTRAKSEGKKVFINFHADWCVYCKKMEKDTFAKSRVIDYLNDNFIAITVNTDKERKVAERYAVRGLPDNWFLDEKGERIGNRPGYITAKQFMKMLEMVHTDGYKKQ